MPNRHNIDAEGYRYAYQGQEKDPETGKEAFELRLWDSRIGRWLTTDPAGQYSSPYLGMGNNPINGIDADGGLFGWIRARWHQMWNGGSVYKNDYDQWVWSSDTTLSGNNMQGYYSSEMEMKNFGYGFLGKRIITYELGASGKVDMGFANLGMDTGYVGYRFRGATIDVAKFNFGVKEVYRKDKFWNDVDFYIDDQNNNIEGNTTTGTLACLDLEFGEFGDYWFSKSFSSVDSKPKLAKTTNDAYIGFLVARLHVTKMSLKGIDYSLNIEENVGGAFIFGFDVNAALKANVSWKF